MSDPRVEEPLNDAALDREIEELLGLEPSPQFVARVRARVSREPGLARAPWRGRWGLAVGLATATVLATTLYVGRVPRSGPAGSAQGSQTRNPAYVNAGTRDAAYVDTGSPAADNPRRETRPTVPATASVSRFPVPPLDEPFRFAELTAQPLVLPEVLISPAERRALARLRVGPEPIEANGEPGIPSLPPLAAIEIPDIEVAPLRQIAALEIQGDRP